MDISPFSPLKHEVELATKAGGYLQALIKFMQKVDPDESELGHLLDALGIVQMFTEHRRAILQQDSPNNYSSFNNTTNTTATNNNSNTQSPWGMPQTLQQPQSQQQTHLSPTLHPFTPSPPIPSHSQHPNYIQSPADLNQNDSPYSSSPFPPSSNTTNPSSPSPLSPSLVGGGGGGLLNQLLEEALPVDKGNKRKCPESRIPIPGPYYLGDVKLHHKSPQQLHSPQHMSGVHPYGSESNPRGMLGLSITHNTNNNNNNTTTTTTSHNDQTLPYAGTTPSYETSMTESLPLSSPSLTQRIQSEPQKWALEQFSLLHALGLGSYASVRLCQDKITGKYYCIKILSKAKVRSENQMEHVRNEKKILSWISHPFIMKMYSTFQDQNNLYFLLEYIAGGELFTHIKTRGRLSDATAKFYAAEIILAVRYLHSLDIAHRDLKPENILLDANGHVKVSDFGFAKQVSDKTWTMCGTPEYIAPEIILSRGHDKSVDWWSLGILIYEMLVGHTPFKSTYPFETFQNILSAKVQIPDHVTPTAKDLIEKLLVHDTTRRLGSSRGRGAQEVMLHPWFHGINWNDLYEMKYRAPINPGVTWQGDTHNYATYSEGALQAQEKTAVGLPQPPPEMFQEF